MEKKFNYNYLSIAFIYLVSGIFLVSSFSIEDRASRTFPQVLCGLSILLATIFMIHVISGKEDGNSINLAGTKGAMIMAGLILLYIIAIYLGGYYVATVIYLPVGMIFLGQRSWKTIIGVDAGVMLVIYLFFGLILSMQMPEGLFF